MPQTGVAATTLRIRDVMTSPVRTLDRHESLDIADEVMTMSRVRHLPVIENRRVVGVVSQRDLFRSALAAALGIGGAAQRSLLKSVEVREVMSAPVVTVTPDDTLAEAARRLLEHRIGCLPVVEGAGELVGIVTDTDVLRQLAGS